MKHEDFLAEYMQIKKKEVETLNTALSDNFDGVYHFDDGIVYVDATMPHTSTPVPARLLEIRAPVTSDGGLFVKPVDYVDVDRIEIGYLDIGYGDIDYVLDILPELWKSYTFIWEGGNLPMRETKDVFDCDADAMKSAREFLKAHHIDIINVFEGEGKEKRYVVAYSK